METVSLKCAVGAYTQAHMCVHATAQPLCYPPAFTNEKPGRGSPHKVLVGIKNVSVTTSENSSAGPQKVNIKLYTTQQISLLCICPGETKTRAYTETRTGMFVAALSVRVLNRKQPKCLPTVE